jgi:hypothetical protein
MEYVGKLYGKIGKKHFDTGRNSAEWDHMQKRIIELESALEKLNPKVFLIEFASFVNRNELKEANDKITDYSIKQFLNYLNS